MTTMLEIRARAHQRHVEQRSRSHVRSTLRAQARKNATTHIGSRNEGYADRAIGAEHFEVGVFVHGHTNRIVRTVYRVNTWTVSGAEFDRRVQLALSNKKVEPDTVQDKTEEQAEPTNKN